MISRKLIASTAVICPLIASAVAQGDELNAQQIQIIKDTASDICTTVKQVRGEKTDVQIQGEIQARLAGLAGKLADFGGSAKGAIAKDSFEGLSQEATAIALQGDRDCRERVFNKMFDKLSAGPLPLPQYVLSIPPPSPHVVDRYVELKPGISTLADAVKIFGEPAARTFLSDGRVGIHWSWNNFDWIVIVFGRNNRMLKVYGYYRSNI